MTESWGRFKLVDDIQRYVESFHGCHGCLQIGSDWPQMGQMWDFLRSIFSTFWFDKPKCTEILSYSASQNVLKTDMKKSHICPIWGQSDITESLNCFILVLYIEREQFNNGQIDQSKYEQIRQVGFAIFIFYDKPIEPLNNTA